MVLAFFVFGFTDNLKGPTLPAMLVEMNINYGASGIGKVVGSLIGALVMGSLSSGMNLMGIDISIQYIVKAAVLAAAVIFDVATRSRGK